MSRDGPRCKPKWWRPGIPAGNAEVYGQPGFASAYSNSGKVTAYQGVHIWLQPVSSPKSPNATRTQHYWAKIAFVFQTQKKSGHLIE